MTRSDIIAAFLADRPWARVPLAGDASARRYERLRDGDRRAILMDVPPESGLALTPFLSVTRWLRSHGLSAPEILAADPENGLLLLEDLGDDLFAVLCAADPSHEPELYAAAIDLLAHLQTLPPPTDWTPPPYDRTVLMREARLLTEWYAPLSGDLAAEFDARAEDVFSLLAAPTVPIYRDYHAENLLWLPERVGFAKIGLLDYQDMLIGHPAYDLVSLLEDARRDIAPDLRAHLLSRYLDRAGADRETFVRDAHILAAQRNMKILGLFTRLHRRDGKPRYLTLLPRVWGLLQLDLAHPALAPLRDFVTRHVPAP